MKKIIAIALMFAANVAFGQTFPVQNLSVAGSATFNGAVNTPALTSNSLLVSGSPTTVVSPGTVGQILTSAGAGNPPSFQTFPGTPSVTTVSNLRSTLSASYQLENVLGYYSAGDGGGGLYQYNSSDTTSGAYYTGSISGSVLTVSAVTNGTLAVNQQINGTGITVGACNISSLGTGTGGTGTYNLNCSPGTIASETMTADLGGGIIVAKDGARWDLVQATPVNARQFGAAADGTTDDYYTITNELAYTPAVALLTQGAYRVSKGLAVANTKSLQGQDFGSFYLGTTSDSMPVIIGDLSVPTIVSVDEGAYTTSVALKNVMVTRASGAIPGGSVGIQIQGANTVTAQDVLSYRSDIDILLGGGATTSLGIHCNRCYTGAATTYHVKIQNAVEVTCSECRLGRNTGSDVNSSAYVDITGYVDTVRFLASQFNQSGGAANYVIAFTSFTGDTNGIISFEQCHGEQFNGGVSVDGSSITVNRLRFVGNTFDSVSAGIFYNGAASKLSNMELLGNEFNNMSFTLDQQSNSVITGNIFGVVSGTFLVNAGTQVITGNSFTGAVTLQGSTSRTIFLGNGVAGGLSNTMTGTYIINNNI